MRFFLLSLLLLVGQADASRQLRLLNLGGGDTSLAANARPEGHGLTTLLEEDSHTIRADLKGWFQAKFGVDPSAALDKLQGIGDKMQDNHAEKEYKLFKKEDAMHWIVFSFVFVVLIIFDNAILNRNPEAMSMRKACLFVVFWIFTALCFAVYVWLSRSLNDCFDWSVGYMLEWMLSLDNLFVFHLVFKKFHTPDNLKHKPLFYGIVGAIIFRMLFFCIGEIAMHKIWWMHIIFALFLIYTGIKAGTSDDEDDDPQKNPFFIWLSTKIPFLNGYDPEGKFFIRCKVNAETGEIIPPRSRDPITSDSESGIDQPIIFDQSDYYREDPAPRLRPQDNEQRERRRRRKYYEWRATLLFLVIICLEITDVIFAVDSVSAIIAQIPDLYLAYTACVFAMLGLRATFFVIEALVQMFSLLKYGVALTLIFIGVKLILKGFVHIHPFIVFCVLIVTIGTSMIASVIHDRYFAQEEDEAGKEEQKMVASK